MVRPNGKIVGIDQLRGLAALAVVLSHIAGHFYGLDRSSDGPAKLWGWLGQWAVALFFVISGFCIRLPMARAGLQNSDARLDVREYLIHRFTRIAPPYWVALALSALVGSFITLQQLSGVHGWLDVAVHLIALHTLLPSTFFSINGVFWTIAIEVHFYLAYLIIADRPARWSTLAVLLVIALAVYGLVSKVLPPTNPWRIVGQELFITSFWQWYLGAVLADLLTRQPCTPPKLGLWAVRAGFLVASLSLGLIDPTLFHLHLTYWLVPVLAGGVVASFAVSPRSEAGPNLLSRAMRFLGRISYSLYLLHPVALALVVLGLRVVPAPAWIGSALALIAAVLLAFAGYQLIERPSLAWRRRQASTVEEASPEPLAEAGV